MLEPSQSAEGLDRVSAAGKSLAVNVQEEFWHRLKQEWLPAYCNDPARNYDIAGFRTDAKRVTDVDARDFMRALDHKVVTVDSGGRFRMPRSSVNEVIFWEHPAKVSPRPISLWIEPVITIAAIARLHLDYGWPVECLGMQSVDWAFDFMAFKVDNLEHEFIAGEVKTTTRELDRFLAGLHECCAAGDHDCANANPARKNAHKKWLGLKRSRAQILWALGPDGQNKVFDVLSNKDRTIRLNPATEQRIRFRS
jgi:hypothetical protein